MSRFERRRIITEPKETSGELMSPILRFAKLDHESQEYIPHQELVQLGKDIGKTLQEDLEGLPTDGTAEIILQLFDIRKMLDILNLSGEYHTVTFTTVATPDDTRVAITQIETGLDAEFTIDEIETFLRPMRRALLEGIQSVVDTNAFRAATEMLDQKGHVWKLHDETVLLTPHKHEVVGRKFLDENAKNKVAALSHLYTLEDRSPYISYTGIAYDNASNNGELYERHTLFEHKSLTQTTKEWGSTDTQTLMRYISQIAEALQFLIQNDLRLTDISCSNILIDTQNQKALLYDFDTLTIQEEESQEITLKEYIAYKRQFPPEIVRPKLFIPLPPAVATMEHMVFEFGTMVRDAGNRIEEPQLLEKLGLLGCITEDPRRRLTINDVMRIIRKHDIPTYNNNMHYTEQPQQ